VSAASSVDLPLPDGPSTAVTLPRGTSRSIPDSTVRVPRSRRTSDRRTAMSCVGVATGMRERARERGAASRGRNPAQDGQIRLNGAGVDEPRGTGIIAQSGAPLWEWLQPRAFCSLPCEGRGGLGRGFFRIIANREHPLPASPCLRRGGATAKGFRRSYKSIGDGGVS